MHKTLAALNHTYPEEQARTNRQPSSINVPSSPTEAASSDDNGLEIEDDNPYSKHLERDPTIWSLYMKKTEKEVKELANSLQVGVDDLLIFAGLFGAILTAFLIESRKDFQVDPLQEILFAVTTSPPFQVFQIIPYYPLLSTFCGFLVSVTLSSATFVPYLHENGWRSIFLYPPEVAQVMHANVSFVLREHSNGTSSQLSHLISQFLFASKRSAATAIPEHHRSPSMSRNTRDIGARSPVNEYVERLAAVLLTYNLYEQELESVDGLNLFFRFRWVLIAFKREFVFDGVLRMWEVLWTDYH
ncbi:hypothetical protein BU17DRAFT_100056 [Hysterangium stoloniferum]|nr:hypothetical protein BU17DRAFT_100056 [Hysterangium stoloniferum]